MRLELDGHIEIGTFSTDVVPNGVNVITAKWVFAWKIDIDGYIPKAKARLVARGFGQQLGVDYFNTFSIMFARLGTNYEIKNQCFFAILEAMTTD